VLQLQNPQVDPTTWRSYLRRGGLITHTKRQRRLYGDWLRARWPTGQSSSPGRVKNLRFSTSSRPSQGHTRPIQRASGPFPGDQIGWGVTLTIRLQVVARSRKCGSILPLPHTSSWISASLVKHMDIFIFTITFTEYKQVMYVMMADKAICTRNERSPRIYQVTVGGNSWRNWDKNTKNSKNMQDLLIPQQWLWRMSSSGIQKHCSYLTGNTLRLCYRVQPVNAM
jgi:hypothetical protein